MIKLSKEELAQVEETYTAMCSVMKDLEVRVREAKSNYKRLAEGMNSDDVIQIEAVYYRLALSSYRAKLEEAWRVKNRCSYLLLKNK